MITNKCVFAKGKLLTLDFVPLNVISTTAREKMFNFVYVMKRRGRVGGLILFLTSANVLKCNGKRERKSQ